MHGTVDNKFSRSVAVSGTLTESTRDASTSTTRNGRVGDYLALTKPEITFLVVLSSVGGFVLGSPFAINAWTLAVTIVGVGLCSAGAGALNHFLERNLDASMRRTAGRPIPAGRVSARNARNVGIAFSAAGLAILCPLVNPLTSILAALTIGLYLFVYTPMKRSTPLNTLVGTLPGALPVVGGYAAATNSLSGLGAWILFGVLVCWQMPHFLSLAWMYRRDYDRGGFAMVSVGDPTGRRTASQSLLFSLTMVACSSLLFVTGELGAIYLVVALLSGVCFLVPAVRFWSNRTNTSARSLLKASVLYIPILVLAVVFDRLLV